MKKNVTLDQIKLLYASIMRKVKEIFTPATEMELITTLAEAEIVTPLIDSDNSIFIDNQNNIYIL